MDIISAVSQKLLPIHALVYLVCILTLPLVIVSQLLFPHPVQFGSSIGDDSYQQQQLRMHQQQISMHHQQQSQMKITATTSDKSSLK